MTILHYEDQDRKILKEIGYSYREWLMSKFHGATDTPIDLIPTADEPISATINHARWVITCEKCNYAQMMSNTMRFLCVICENPVWRNVHIPDKDAIATLVSSLPAGYQHWHGESIDELTDMLSKVN